MKFYSETVHFILIEFDDRLVFSHSILFCKQNRHFNRSSSVSFVSCYFKRTKSYVLLWVCHVVFLVPVLLDRFVSFRFFPYSCCYFPCVCVHLMRMCLCAMQMVFVPLVLVQFERVAWLLPLAMERRPLQCFSLIFVVKTFRRLNVPCKKIILRSHWAESLECFLFWSFFSVFLFQFD